MQKKAILYVLFACILATIFLACSAQTDSMSEVGPSNTPTVLPTFTPSTTPSPTLSPTPSPTATPLYYVRADSQAKSTDPNTFTYIGTLFEYFDPATSSGQLIQNVYETLVFYDGEKPDVFVPHLAESWEISSDGKEYTFHIREGVKFHNGDILTPSDVAFSFQRNLLLGGSSSSQWLLSEPIFGIGILDISQLVDPSGALFDDNEGIKKADPEILKSACEKVKSAIIADDTAGTVTVKLTQAWNAFLPTLAHPSASIMDAKWVAQDQGIGTCIRNGKTIKAIAGLCQESPVTKETLGWDGSCDTWQNYYAVWDNPFKNFANGTGPFILDYWGDSGELVLTRNDDYWRKPANLERVNIKYERDVDKIFSQMNLNIADGVWAQDTYRKQIEEFVGERCEYDPIANVYKPCEMVDETKSFVIFNGRPANFQSVLLFNFDIPGSYGNAALGSARLDGKGIPGDFFSDVHIRKAFAYCLDWDTFIKDAYGENVYRSSQLLLPDVLGFNPDSPYYQFDLAACEKEFKLADIDKDGIPAGEDPDDVWETGFQLMVPKNYSNVTEIATKILAKNVKSINTKFLISLWATKMSSSYAPIRIGSWSEDIHDPYNWFQPFTIGTYGQVQSLPNDLKAQFQEIFNRGLAEKDPLKKAEIYNEANILYFNNAIGLPLAYTTDDYFWHRSVQGMSLNPFFPRSYFYPIYKK